MSGQEQCIRRALRKSGVDPSTISLVEAHGTGTPVGDKLELTALKNVLQEGSDTEKESVAVGSIKSQIGHTKAVAGAAGMVKTVLALMHKTLPMSINCKNPPAPLLDDTDIHDSPIYINTKTRPWFTKPGVPRRAGISSFGFGGANYHCILEEYEHEHDMAYRLNRTPRSVVFAAPAVAQLVQNLKSIAAKLGKDLALDQFCKENALGASPLQAQSFRVGFVIGCESTAADCAKVLEKAAQELSEGNSRLPEGSFYGEVFRVPNKLAVVFPSEKEIKLHQFEELALNWPTYRVEIEAGDSATAGHTAKRLSQVLYPRSPYEEEYEREIARQTLELSKEEFSRPCSLAASLGVYRIFEAAGVVPTFATGYGVGNLAAKVIKSELDRDSAFKKALSGGNAVDPSRSVVESELSGFQSQGATLFLVLGSQPRSLSADECVRLDQSEMSLHTAAVRLFCQGFNFTKRFDPFVVYRSQDGPSGKQSKTKLKLSATTYVSPKTLKMRESVVNDGKLLSYCSNAQPAGQVEAKQEEAKQQTLERELNDVKAEVESLRKELSSLKGLIHESKQTTPRQTKVHIPPAVELAKMEQLYEELLKIYNSYP